METATSQINSVEELGAVLAESGTRPVLLFKHSLTCPISSWAYREFQQHLEDPNPGVDYRLITIQRVRQVSDEVSRQLEVKHESPQAILVWRGKAVWHASHTEITAKDMERAIASVLANQ